MGEGGGVGEGITKILEHLEHPATQLSVHNYAFFVLISKECNHTFINKIIK